MLFRSGKYKSIIGANLSALQQCKSSEIGSSMCATESSGDGLLLPSVANRSGGILCSEAFFGWLANDSTTGRDRLKPATFDVRLVCYVRHAQVSTKILNRRPKGVIGIITSRVYDA